MFSQTTILLLLSGYVLKGVYTDTLQTQLIQTIVCCEVSQSACTRFQYLWSALAFLFSLHFACFR